MTSMGTRIPDLVIKRENQAMILDIKVVETRVSLADAHEAKRDMNYPGSHHVNAAPAYSVDSDIKSSRNMGHPINRCAKGYWARPSGLQDHDHTCLQGGLHGFRTHQRTTPVRAE
ncbi:hypothetical protein HPB49_024040 [Dermacentor silvarum]|uniref:Uncharacterized protein n=1 Tax=Dermacentor silvarum TaxID=543639 RepID=A0ACB8DRY0_DERSI|nr:hypothetical protein HPB49_024040 [Dermacentor silvarum]